MTPLCVFARTLYINVVVTNKFLGRRWTFNVIVVVVIVVVIVVVGSSSSSTTKPYNFTGASYVTTQKP